MTTWKKSILGGSISWGKNIVGGRYLIDTQNNKILDNQGNFIIFLDRGGDVDITKWKDNLPNN